VDLNIAVELKEGLLRVTANGNFTLDAALRLLKEVCDTAVRVAENRGVTTAMFSSE
jgi:hypothetical protein